MLHDVVQRKKFYTLVLQKCLTRSNINNVRLSTYKLLERSFNMRKLTEKEAKKVSAGKIKWYCQKKFPYSCFWYWD